jgi:hypothetical protein
MSYAMDGWMCADCEMFHELARDAIMQHVCTESRLAIARLIHDCPRTGVLEPVVEHLLRERTAAVRTYQEHVAAHAKEAVSATMTQQKIRTKETQTDAAPPNPPTQGLWPELIS